MFKRKVKAKEYSSITIAGLEIVTNSIIMPTSSYEDSLLPELWEEFWSIFPKSKIVKNNHRMNGIPIISPARIIIK